MKYGFHPEARVEFLKSVRYYESQQAGLDRRFLVAVMHLHRKPGYWERRDAQLNP